MLEKYIGLLKKQFLSIEGRISRSGFIGWWIRLIVLILILDLISIGMTKIVYLGDILSTILAVLSTCVLIFFIIGIVNIKTKRSHDLGYTGWLQLIPFYGLFLVFMKGTKGENKYGIDPLQEDENRIKDIKPGKKTIKKLKTKN